MLKLEQVHAYYGESHILRGISLELNRGELVTLLGRNGVGKTTTLKSIMGLVSVRSGSIQFKDENIMGEHTHEIFRKGLGYVPQGRHIFSSLSVRENLMLARRHVDGERLEWVLNLFPALRRRLKHWGNQLSGGEQQMLAIARVLLSGPELILLDEPSEGLAPVMVSETMDAIQKLKETGLTILLVETNLIMASKVGSRHYVLSHGVVDCQADSRQIVEDAELQKKYFKL